MRHSFCQVVAFLLGLGIIHRFAHLYSVRHSCESRNPVRLERRNHLNGNVIGRPCCVVRGRVRVYNWERQAARNPNMTEDEMATYQQDDDHDRITHIDMLNLLRQDMREGFAQQREVLAQQREAFNTRFDALDDKVDTKVDAVDAKVDGVDSKIDTHIADHTAQANESKTGRRWLIGIGIGMGITVSGILGQYLPAIIRALQSGP